MNEYSLPSHRLLATIRKLDCVGSLDSLAVGVFAVAEVSASILILHSVSEVVGDGVLIRERETQVQDV